MDDRKKVLPIRKPGGASSCFSGLRIGTILGTDANGHYLLAFAGEDTEHTVARVTSCAKKNLQKGSVSGREVLVAFEEESLCPIIIDTLHFLRNEQYEWPGALLDPEEMEAEQRHLILKAEEEIVLQCGEASITLTSAGKVLIKGNYVVSRSSGTNSIKGSSVRIN